MSGPPARPCSSAAPPSVAATVSGPYASANAVPAMSTVDHDDADEKHQREIAAARAAYDHRETRQAAGQA
ncbi:hypothetical protein AB0O67_05690 [Streptomyces sp. NPDC086077]|uniref:hypothetical protein n=1 Tax=Streptomyces sp. NPDC086077 TaxID=3154862 RepID=UPI0034175EF2